MQKRYSIIISSSIR